MSEPKEPKRRAIISETLPAPVDFTGLAVAADGKTVYAGEVLGHVRRELLVNFADRPR